jgi:eukaryotic-like serine/threonine-protein kinase
MTHTSDRDSAALDSWKEIASYVGRDVRTVQRWERLEGLPIHRHHHAKLGSVYAYRQEIDRWRDQRSVASSKRAKHRIAPEAKGIVVVPFVNLSPDRTHDYISDGLNDEIITDLSKVRSLRVISRNSAMQLKGTNKDTRTIGRELNVRYVVQGSVRTAGNTLRISAQLIDATNDTHVWVEKYAGTLDDVLDLQETLSRQIVDALKLTLSPEEERLIAERPIRNIQAYECYLRARHEIYRFTDDSLALAQRLAEHAIETVGGNELIYSVVGQAYLLYLLWGIKTDDEYVDRASQCAVEIFRLNPDSAHGYALQGMVAYMRGERLEAARLLKIALDVSPGHADALIWLVSLYVRAGKAAPLKPLIHKLLEVDPLTPIVHSWAGWLAWLQEGPGRSLAEANRRMYEMDPRNPYSRFVYAWVLAMCGRPEEALPILDLLVRETPQNGFAQLGTFFRLALQHDNTAALHAVTGELTAWARRDDLASWWMTDCFALINETTQALDWLENSVRRGFINYPALTKQDPFLERLRNQSRFQSIVDTVHKQWLALT